MLTIYASPPPPSPTTTTDTTTSGMGSSGSIKDVDEKTPGTVYGYEKAKLLQKICLENKRMYAELHGLHLIVGTPSQVTSLSGAKHLLQDQKRHDVSIRYSVASS